jgi:hypothetical protein
MFKLIKIFTPEIIKGLVFLILFSAAFIYSQLNRNDRNKKEFIINLFNN